MIEISHLHHVTKKAIVRRRQNGFRLDAIAREFGEPKHIIQKVIDEESRNRNAHQGHR